MTGAGRSGRASAHRSVASSVARVLIARHAPRVLDLLGPDAPGTSTDLEGFVDRREQAGRAGGVADRDAGVLGLAEGVAFGDQDARLLEARGELAAGDLGVRGPDAVGL